jgi:hypothetical protein
VVQFKPMSIDQPERNKMMTGAPAKKEFHFAGDGVFHNLTVIAENMEEATREWLKIRRLIAVPGAGEIRSPTEQSTAAPETAPESEVQ